MKFLLAAINAKYIHSNPAVYSLSAYALKKDKTLDGHIEIAEYTINHQVETVLADIYFRKPDVVGFSCYIWNIDFVMELAEELKKLFPELPIWLGGPEVSFDGPRILEKYPFITGVMTGEGEETFTNLVLRYREAYFRSEGLLDVDFSTISGLVCLEKETGKPLLTRERPLTELTELPFLYSTLEAFENRILYYESSRGCPYRCSYCLSSIDKTVRLRSMETVKKELAFFLEKKVRQVKFVDRTFNCNKKHALEIWNYLLSHDNGITNFHFEVAADIIDEEEIEVLNRMRPGAVQLEIGVQSTNPKTIKEIERRMDIDKLKNVVARIHDGKNIHIHLDLIAGLPYENYASFGNSFNEVYAMKPQQLQLGFLKVLKGSKMYEKAEEYGIVYHSRPPYEVLYTRWLSYAEVCRLKQIEEMTEIYYNSNQFTLTLPLLISRFASPFAFFESLADYYEKSGYFVKSPARSYRYQVLLSFVRDSLGLSSREETLFLESLTIDLYLRENCKTRPDFAPDLDPHKEAIRAFYQMEAKEKRYLKEGYENCDARTLARFTHMEPVSFDFETGELLGEKKYFLFDYRCRNPLTNEAAVYMPDNFDKLLETDEKDERRKYI